MPGQPVSFDLLFSNPMLRATDRAFRVGNIGSLGLAGTIVVALSVVYGLTFLPAALASLGPPVNALSLPFFRPAQLGAASGFWRRIAALVMAHPWRAFLQTATTIIVFCLIFGLSTDYEVLLLSRSREEYEPTGNNALAVAAGLVRTGRLIRWAGAAMARVFFAFALADSVIIKAVGIEIDITVLLGATVVRALLVPATMRLMGRWNWRVPAPIARLCRWGSAPAARAYSTGGG